MRFARMCLLAVVVMAPSQGAHANVQATCAHIAANAANAHVASVDLWLSRYRASYAVCLAQQEGTHDANIAQKPDDQPAEKSANKKAVFKSVKVTPVTLDKKRPAEFSKIEKTLSKPKPKRQKRVIPKPTKKIVVLRAKTPLKLPAPAGKLVRAPKAYRSVGAEGWRINCSARFGGWDKASDYYISSAGKRVSCTVRP
jgi:hypothetical protein